MESSQEDDSSVVKLAMPNISLEESDDERTWSVNVFVEFEDNPAQSIFFRKDSEGKRIEVSDTKDGLELVKGLPVLAVGNDDVCDINGFHELLKNQSYPLLLRFGSRHLKLDQLIDLAGQREFVGKTFSQLLVSEQKPTDDCKDEIADNDDFPAKKMQPISFYGTQGSKENWSEKCKSRAYIITEILDFEKTYIRSLEELSNRFLYPYGELLEDKYKVRIRDFHSTIKNMINLHDNLYDKFIKSDNICKVLQEGMQYLRLYKNLVKDAQEIYKSLETVATKRSFRNIFSKSNMVDALQFFDTKKTAMVQRPGHYLLLLEKLQKNTPNSHPMHEDLEEALKAVRSICGDIDLYQEVTLKQPQFVEIANLIDHISLCEHGINSLIQPSRKLIRAGDVGVRTPGKTKSTKHGTLNLVMGYAVMCNDVLILTYRQNYRVLRICKFSEWKMLVIEEPQRSSKYNLEVFEVAMIKRELGAQLELPRRICNSLSADGIDTNSLDQICFYTKTLKEAEEWLDSMKWVK